MPRRARIDYEGVENLERSRKALHHVMVRGLERREIFRDDQDRESFLNRIEIALEQTAAKCRAFALMPNHVHLLITSGKPSTCSRKPCCGAGMPTPAPAGARWCANG
ncbi:MAG: transposase [Planctomycetota bacterium]